MTLKERQISILKFLQANWFRVCFYFVFLVILLSFGKCWLDIRDYGNKITKSDKVLVADQKAFKKVVAEYRQFKAKVMDYKSQGIDTTSLDKKTAEIKESIFVKGDYTDASKEIGLATFELEKLYEQRQLEIKAAEEAKITGITGKVTSNSAPMTNATISVYSGTTVIGSVKSVASGEYSINVPIGTYKVTCSLAGYTTFQKSEVAVVNVQTTGLDITLTKAPPKPVVAAKPKSAPTTSSGSASTTYTSYSRQSVKASAGTFTVDIMKLDLGSGHIRVITDTAANGDCTNNCPTMSLASYASRNGAFAGINGTYFCPKDYASCAGQVNSFWWKFYNSRLGIMINATNGKGAMEPFFIFDSMGRASYLSHWKDYSSYDFTAGISSSPGLIYGGVSVLNNSTLDTKQRTVKSNRGALALKGQILYAVIAKGATVPDLTSVLLALGVDYGLNIDGGGSSAMLYKGAYKVGPGRSLPNAVLFVEN